MIDRHMLERATQAIRDKGDMLGNEMTRDMCRALALAALKATNTFSVLYRENTSDAQNLRLQFEWPDDQPWPASVRACKGEAAGYVCQLYRPADPSDKSVV